MSQVHRIPRRSGPTDSISAAPRRTVLIWAAVVLAAVQVVAGIVMSGVGNTEGWLGGVLFGLMYAVPLLLIAWELWHGTQRSLVVTGWIALVLAAFYAVVVLGNWSGYSPAQAGFALGITVPTVLLDVAVFWSTVPHRHAPG